MADIDFPTTARPGLFRRTLRRHSVGLVLTWFFGTVAAIAACSLFLLPTYRAASLLRVDPEATDLYSLRDKPENLEPFLQTQVQLITSPNVLTAAATNAKASVLERVQKAGDVVQELRKAVTVEVVPNTYLIQVSMISKDNYEAATLVNAVVDAFLEANDNWSDGMTRARIKNLERYGMELKNQTDELERRWKTLVAGGDPDRKARQANLISPEQGAKIETKLIDVDLDRLEAQAQLDALRARPNRDQAKVDDLETRIAAAMLLERALNERRASGGFEPRNPKSDSVDITLIQEERKILKEMQESVFRRLEQLRYEVKGEARIRPINSGGAMVPGRPIADHRPTAYAVIPFAVLLLSFGLFAGIEALPRWTASTKPGPGDPSREV